MNYKLTMRFRPFISFLLLLVTLGGLSACKKKRPALPPPQAQVPSIILPLPEPLPPPTTTPEPNHPQPENVPAAENKPPVKKHPHVIKRPQQPPTTAQSTQPPPQPQRPAEDTQLTATNNPQEALHQQLNTTQLLDATENNLKTLNRSLSTDEEAMIQHIRSYMQQSRTALDQKDFERAYNLAYKARLLSDELIKH
jgi:outer membrane biosynthesis protein TonB